MKAFQILEAAKRVCVAKRYRAVESRLEQIGDAPHYCERGYSTSHDAILFGNWNNPMPSTWEDEKRVHAAKDEPQAQFFKGVVKALESCAELEWSDEWTTCADCNGAVRTSPDSYGWMKGYLESDDGPICSDCARKDPFAILESLEDGKSLTGELGIDPRAHGYLKIDQEFETGFHGGQDASAEKIADSLRKRGISRFLFVLDSVGQFDADFSVWVHESEKHLMPDQLSHQESASELDPAEGMKRALLSIKIPSGDGITYSKLDPSTGTSETRKVSPDEFIGGIK